MTNRQRVELLELVGESEGVEDFWLDPYDDHYRYRHNTIIINSVSGEVYRVALDEYDQIVNRYTLSDEVVRRLDDALIHESRLLIVQIQSQLKEISGGYQESLDTYKTKR